MYYWKLRKQKKKMVQFKHKIGDKYTIVTFELGESALAPSDLVSLSPPDAVANSFAHKGVILSGRGPVWLFGFLVHFYHPTKWLATYDPRLEGAVVVASHTLEIKTGDLIPLSTEQL